MSDEHISVRCVRLGQLCTDAMEAFKVGSEPYNWLKNTANLYQEASVLLSDKSKDMSIKLVATEEE